MDWKLRKMLVLGVLAISCCAPSVRGDEADDQYAVAARHYEAARWELAIDELTSFLTAFPDHPRAESVTFYLAESFMQLGRWDDACARFADYLQRSPDGKHALQSHFRLGEAHYLAGRMAEAREQLQRFRQRYPDDGLNAYVLPYLGETALALDDVPAAQEALTEALRRYPDGPLAADCRYAMARALQSLGDLPGAERFYQFVNEQGTASPLGDDAALQLGVLHYEQQRFAQAVDTLRSLLERFPGSDLLPHAHYWLGMSQIALEDYTSAAATLNQALDRYGSHELAPAMAFAAADAYRRGGQSQQAEPLCQRILQQWPHGEWADDSLQILVRMAYESSNDPRVAELAEQFMRQYADSPLRDTVQECLGCAHLKAGRFEDAIAALEPLVGTPVPAQDSVSESSAAAGAAANTLTVTYYWALAQLGAGHHQQALDALDSLSVADQPAEFVNNLHVARASALVALGRFADAVTPLEAYLAALPAGPDATKCRAQLAVALAHLGRWKEVETVVQQFGDSQADPALYVSTIEFVAESALSANRLELAESLFRQLADRSVTPESTARALSALAWITWRADRGAAQAAEAFGELVQRYPDSPLAAEAAMMRGQALEKAGNVQEALAAYETVIAQYAESPHASAALLAAARLRDELAQDSDAARLLRTWLDRYPAADNRDAALYQLAWVLIDQGRQEEADAVFSQLRSDHRASRYWSDAVYRLAERAARAGDAGRADVLAAEILDAQARGPMTGYALLLRGQLAAAARRWDDVERWMQRLLETEPESNLRVSAEYWLAESHFQRKRYESAGPIYERLAHATEGRTDSWVAMIPLRRAQMRARAGQWDDAYALAQPIARHYPDFAQQHEVDYLLGRYFMNRAEFEQARDAYGRVITSTTGANGETAAMAQWMIGETYFMQKRYRDAIKAYHRAEALYAYPQWQAAALLQAGKCHEVMGQWPEAVRLYAQILQDYPTTRVAAAAASRSRAAHQRADRTKTR